MTDDIITTLIVTAGPVVLAVVSYGLWWLKNRKPSDAEKRTYTDYLDQVVEIHASLNRVVSHQGALRALILYAENGGGRPSVGTPQYISILYEMYGANNYPARADIQRVHVDAAYTSILAKMNSSEHKVLKVLTKDMPASMLRDAYVHAGIEMSIICLIKEAKTRYYYASYSFAGSHATRDIVYECFLEANKIANIFNKMKD